MAKMKLPQAKTYIITVGIARYIIDDMQPFSTVDSHAFRKMIYECEPCCKFLYHKTFSENIIPNLYESVSARIKGELLNAETVTWTTDSWTSRATLSYVTITADFINPDNADMELCSRVLQRRDLPESHTGKHVGNILHQSQLELACKVHVSALTTDNVAYMKITAQTVQTPIHIGCFSHTLNLASGRAFNLKEVHQILAKMRSIVSFMHSSTTASALLSKKLMLELPEKKLLIDVRTSSYLMVERFLEQQLAILATLNDETTKKQHEAKSIQATSILGQNEVRHCS